MTPSSLNKPAKLQLFISPRPLFVTAMDESLDRIIRSTLDEGRAKGRDHLTQSRLAVATAHQARPDLTASELLVAVRSVQRQ
jgi:hypothetical protein